MKKTKKKLTLNRDTVRNLSPEGLEEAQGAGTFRCKPSTPETCFGLC